MANNLIRLGGAALSESEFKERFRTYLVSKQMSQLVVGHGTRQFHFCLNFVELSDFDSVLAYCLVNFPSMILPVFVDELKSVLSNVSSRLNPTDCKVDLRDCWVRIYSLP